MKKEGQWYGLPLILSILTACFWTENLQNSFNTVRQYNGLDRLIIRLEGVLCRSKPVKTQPSRPNPADSVTESGMSGPVRAVSAGLMRVNHAGEVSAQALYQGQGIVARNPAVSAIMQRSAAEEIDHLRWCAQRLDELGSHTSYLNPVWYLGSLSLGIIAGVAGDRWSLGFVAETENQVVRHLDSHLVALPGDDHKSRAILQQMRTDESHHASVAVASGAAELPVPIRGLMRLCSKIMTRTAYWV